MFKLYIGFCICSMLLLAINSVNGQGGSSGSWGGGGGGQNSGAWSNANANANAGPMHNSPGNLGGTTDHQYSYGYAGVDNRGPYGGAVGNGGYYVSGTDEHGRPYSYNGGVGPLPGQPGYGPRPEYPGSYGYRSTATTTTATATTTSSLLGVAGAMVAMAMTTATWARYHD